MSWLAWTPSQRHGGMLRSAKLILGAVLSIHSACPDLAVLLQFDSADNEEKDQAKEGLDKARARSDKYKGRVEEGDKTEPPKVEARLRCSLPAASLRLCNHSLGRGSQVLPANQ